MASLIGFIQGSIFGYGNGNRSVHHRATVVPAQAELKELLACYFSITMASQLQKA